MPAYEYRDSTTLRNPNNVKNVQMFPQINDGIVAYKYTVTTSRLKPEYG